MSVSRLGEPLYLSDDAFRSEAIGRNDIARSLGGRARIAYELAAGENPFPTEASATHPNPQGLLGVDLSGPPYGSALLHPIAWCSGKKTNANVQGTRQVAVAICESYELTIGPWVIWNRPHASLPTPQRAPYSRGRLAIIAHRDSANADLNIDVSADGWQRTSTDTITINSASEGRFLTDNFFDLIPGRNALWIRFYSSAVAANAITIDSIAVHQTVKRSH